MGCLYLRFNKLIQQNPHVSKQQILNSVGEDEDLPDLHDEEDERIHLTPNGIVPLLFVWKMLEKHTRLKRMDCKKSKRCNAMLLDEVCLHFLLNSSVSTLQFLRLSHLGISLNAPRKLSGCPFAEDMMKPWKSAEFLEVANLFRIYPAEAAGENAEFFGCKIGTPKDSAEKRLFSNQLFCVTQNCFKEFM